MDKFSEIKMYVYNISNYFLVQLPMVEYDVDTGSTIVFEDKKKPLMLNTMPTAHTFSIFDE